MEFLAGLLVVFLLVVLLTTSKGSKQADNLAGKRQEQAHIQARINTKREELNNLHEEIQNKTIDRTSNLSNVVNDILNIYEESNIKIPLDIIEELQFMNLSNEKEVFDYIENQRNHWKLENNKKPYRKV